MAAIPPDQEVVVVCYTGQTAGQVTAVLNMLGYEASSLLFGMSSWTSDPDIFVKRFEPETHVSDYAVDTESYLPKGPYELPFRTPAASDEPAPGTSPTPEPAVASVPSGPTNNCVACHTSKPVMQTIAVDTRTESVVGPGEGWAGEQAPLEAWEKALVHEEFLGSIHNTQDCIACHGGVAGIVGKDPAHEGMVRDPLEDSSQACDMCHSAATEHASTSLHQTLDGFRTTLSERGADFEAPEMQAALANHCSDCHTTCGQCHISRPTSQGGGLLDGHEVERMASTSDTCVACHGARVANEYQGENEGVEGSVHWLDNAMPCYDCHEVDQLHGDGTEYSHRYDGAPGVACLECHEEAAPGQTTVKQHQIHSDKVDCYVCHVSGPYKNCFDCHVSLDDEGLAHVEMAESQMAFKIGRNPLKSEDRPWEYSLVRHVPVTPDTFAYYGADLLPSFDNLPTW